MPKMTANTPERRVEVLERRIPKRPHRRHDPWEVVLIQAIAQTASLAEADHLLAGRPADGYVTLGPELHSRILERAELIALERYGKTYQELTTRPRPKRHPRPAADLRFAPPQTS